MKTKVQFILILILTIMFISGSLAHKRRNCFLMKTDTKRFARNFLKAIGPTFTFTFGAHGQSRPALRPFS